MMAIRWLRYPIIHFFLLPSTTSRFPTATCPKVQKNCPILYIGSPLTIDNKLQISRLYFWHNNSGCKFCMQTDCARLFPLMLARPLVTTFGKALILFLFIATTTSLFARVPPLQSGKQIPDIIQIQTKEITDNKSLLDWIIRSSVQEKRAESKKYVTNAECCRKRPQSVTTAKNATELATTSSGTESAANTSKSELISTPSLYILEMATKRFQDGDPD